MTSTASNRRRPQAQALRLAREGLQAGGQLPDGELGPTLARSWQRSRDAGLPLEGRSTGGPHASAAQLARAMERSYELLSHARPVMEHLLPHVQASGGLMLLADARGTVIESLGDDGFAARAQRVALRAGAVWSESVRGTNAIGTALAEGKPMTVHGAEHYLPRNGFLSCSAAPIHDPAGGLLGAVDITGDRRSQHPATLPHTLGLACTAAHMVEHRLFETWHAHALRLRFHPRCEGLGLLGEGLLALGADGHLLGANGVARHALGLDARHFGRWRVDALLDLSVGELFEWARSGVPRAHGGPDGLMRWWRADATPAAVSLVFDSDHPRRASAALKPCAAQADLVSAQDAQARLLHVCAGDGDEARRRWARALPTAYAITDISPPAAGHPTMHAQAPEGAV